MMPKLSVIIPCFNSGEFIDDAISSVNINAVKEYVEIIVVDDGSTDHITLQLLKSYEGIEGITILHQENRGPAAARNSGINISQGDFLLFLDSDNMVRREYIDIAIALMEKDDAIGVVHGKPKFFGLTAEERFIPKEFDLNKVLAGNYIDMCSVVRKSMLEEIGLFDENRLIIGHEDWELWIRAGSANWKFIFVDRILFDYRIRKDSLIVQANASSKVELMKEYVYSKHWKIFLDRYSYLAEQNTYYEFDKVRPFRAMLKYLFLKFKK